MIANPLSRSPVVTRDTSLHSDDAAAFASYAESFVKYIDLNCSASISRRL